jgi:hypothetical protein
VYSSIKALVDRKSKGTVIKVIKNIHKSSLNLYKKIGLRHRNLKAQQGEVRNHPGIHNRSKKPHALEHRRHK